MKKVPLFVLLNLLIGLAFSQQKLLRFEGQLIVDNDAFTGDLTQDQYYSSGIYPAFRMLRDSIHHTKVIRSYQLNHRMFTPSWIGEDVAQWRDRPYAGLISGSIANEYYLNNGIYLKGELEIGWMGPKTLVGETQRTWHQWFGMQKPLGWNDQIRDTPMINVNLKYIRSFVSNVHVDFSNEWTSSFGTIFNFFRYDMVVRLGKLLPMNQSAYTGSGIGRTLTERIPEKPTLESYFFYAPGLELVLYNATLQGSLFNDHSPFTVTANRWVWQHRFGAMFSWESFDLGFIAYFRQSENPGASRHKFVGIRLNQRF